LQAESANLLTAMALEDSFFTSPTGTKLHYVETGDSLGTIILGLHGLGGSTSTFEPLLQHIPKGYRTVLLDFPGFGNSTLSSPERRLSIDGHVTDLDHFVTHLQGTCNGKTKYKVRSYLFFFNTFGLQLNHAL
jgi:alpha-beta hydrolase superfamily lysophospholipase